MADTIVSAGPRRRFVIVRNARAGRLSPTLMTRVIGALVREGAVVAVCDTSSAADLAAIREKGLGGVDAVIAAGGDGTIRALAIAFGTSLPIGIIPVGTGNVMAHEIGLSRNADDIARTLMHGPVVKIEGGRANGEPFFLMAGVGLDGAIVQALNIAAKQRLGRAAYVVPTLRAMLSGQPKLTVRLDGAAERDAEWVIVTRASRYGGVFTLTQRSGLLKPGLVAVLFRPRHRAQLARQLLALGTGSLDTTEGVDILPCLKAEVRSPTPVPTQLDGDVFTPTPLVVEAGGPRLSLIVPKTYVS